MPKMKQGSNTPKINFKASRYWLFLLLLSYHTQILGQGSPLTQNYGIEDYGVNSPQNWDIAQHPSGVMLFGNNLGIIVFNGIEWSRLETPGRGIVRALHLSESGTVFYGGREDFGYIGFDSLGGLKSVNLPSSLGVDFTNFGDIWGIVEIDGAIYFQTYSHIIRFDGSNLEIFPSELRLNAISKIQNKIILRVAGRGLIAFEEGVYTDIPGTEIFGTSSLGFTLDVAGTDWLFSANLGIFKLTEAGLAEVSNPLSDSLKIHRPYRGELLPDGNIAVATFGGGVIISDSNGSIVSLLNQSNELPTNTIYNLNTDHEGNLWLATNAGITKVSWSLPILLLKGNHGLEGIVTTISAVGKSLLVGTTDGLFLIDTGNSYPEPERIPGTTRVYSSVVHNELVYYSTTQGIFSFDNGSILQISTSRALKLEISGDWLYLIDDRAIRRMSLNSSPVIENFITNEFPVSDIEIYDNQIWLLSINHGLTRYTLDGNYIDSHKADIPERSTYWTIKQAWGRLLVGTDNGLFWFNSDEGRFEKDTTFSDYDEQIEERQVALIQVCEDQTVWLRSAGRSKKIRQLGSQWDISSHPYNEIAFSRSISSILCIPEEKRVYFGGIDGLYTLMEHREISIPPFKAIISGMYLKRDSLVYSGYSGNQIPLDLSYANNEIRFRFGKSSFINPKIYYFSYKLDGYESDWSSWSTEPFKDYTNLMEGSYTFNVRSRNVLGVISEDASVSFIIRPPWHRTWWAYILYALLISNILYVAYKIRINQIMKLQRIRNRIASDLHDEVSATLSGISYFAQAIDRDPNPQNKTRFVNLINDSANDAKEKITDIIWAINPDNDDWTAFLSKCRRYASDLLESKNIKYSLKIDDRIDGKPDMQVRQHLWLIFKETVTNAIRHSGGTRLDIVLKSEDNRLKLIVQDNGNGFPKDDMTHGNGILNIKKRAAIIKADVTLSSEPGMGTRWQLELDL